MSEQVKKKKNSFGYFEIQDDGHYIDEDEVKRRFRVFPATLSRARTVPSKIEINLKSTRPISKFLSKIIPYEFGASTFFHHRWLEGFRSEHKIGSKKSVGKPFKLQRVFLTPNPDFSVQKK